MIKVNGIETADGFFYVTDSEMAKIDDYRQRVGFASLYKDGHCKGTSMLRIANTRPAKYVIRCGRGWYHPV